MSDYKVTVIWPKGANVRPAPNINNVALRTLPPETVLTTPYAETTDANGDQWIRISASPAEYIATNYADTVRALVELIGQPPAGETTIVAFTMDSPVEVKINNTKVWPQA